MKFAYLIIANRNHQQLQKLLTMLDDSRNDIYLLVDKKSKNFRCNFNLNYSTLNYLRPINIYWGSYSQIQAELCLFKAAAPYHYDYYHLLSGVDLPLVNQDIVHNFFNLHPNKEFLTYGNPINLYNIDLRLKYHLFRKHYREWPVKIFRHLENIFLKIIPQHKLNEKYIGYASNWVSIDDKLVQLIIRSIPFIYETFRYGYLVDELFIPTLINLHPKFIHKIYYKDPMHDTPTEFQGNLRYINWWNGNPYIWKIYDYNELIKAKNKGYLFSRKFDSTIDNNIINKIFDDVMRS